MSDDEWMKLHLSLKDPGDFIKLCISMIWISLALTWTPDDMNQPNSHVYTWWDCWKVYLTCLVMLYAIWTNRSQQ